MGKTRYNVKKFHLHGDRDFVFLSAEELAALASVQISTAYRWINTGKIDATTLELLKLKALGELPNMHGMQLKDGILTTANGYCLTLAQLEHYGMMLPLLEGNLREISRLKAENARLRKWAQVAPRITNEDCSADQRSDFRFYQYGHGRGRRYA